MNSTANGTWKSKRTDETNRVEESLRNAGFPDVAAYRYNSASIRVRVIDPRFEGLSFEKRDEMIEPVLEKFPERTQADIMSLFTFAPSELQPSPKTHRQYHQNAEFVQPSSSVLV